MPQNDAHMRFAANTDAAAVFASVILILASLIYGGAAYSRNGVWKSSLSLASDNARKSPVHPRVRLNLGMAYKDLEMFEEAKAEFRAAARIAPDYADAHNNLANVFFVQGRLQEALAEYREVLRLRPDHVEAHYNMAIANLELGEEGTALKHFQIFVRLAPSSYRDVVEEARAKIEELRAQVREERRQKGNRDAR